MKFFIKIKNHLELKNEIETNQKNYEKLIEEATNEIIPAIGQGIIAVQCRKDDEKIKDIIKSTIQVLIMTKIMNNLYQY